MDQSQTYEIHVEGHLPDTWSCWFEGLTIRPLPCGQTALSGLFVDQAALFGALAKIQSLNLTLVAVTRCDPRTAE